MGVNGDERSSARQHVRSDIQTAEIRTKVWLEVDGRFALGDGGLDLLRAIAEERSLTTAARRIGWSYKHAWAYLRHAEHVLQIELTQTLSGKGRTRGTELTRRGMSVMRALIQARDHARVAAHRAWRGAVRERVVLQRGAVESRDRNQ
jgi:molybdate transport system regulatory protein